MMHREVIYREVPPLEVLRELTDEAWDYYWSSDNRASRTLGRDAPCPVCGCDPDRHNAEDEPEQWKRPGCTVCSESAAYGAQERQCPMTPALIEDAYLDRGIRRGFLPEPEGAKA